MTRRIASVATFSRDVDAWIGCSVFLFGLLVVVFAAVRLGPQEPECDPACADCGAWRYRKRVEEIRSHVAFCPQCMVARKGPHPHD